MNNVTNICSKPKSGKKYLQCTHQNLINLALYLISQSTVLVFLNKRKLTLKNFQSKKMFGNKFPLIISSQIRLILLLGFHRAKLTKDKYFCLVAKSFWKARQQINVQQIEHYKNKFMFFNQKLIHFNWKVHSFPVLVFNMVNFIQ